MDIFARGHLSCCLNTIVSVDVLFLFSGIYCIYRCTVFLFSEMLAYILLCIDYVCLLPVGTFPLNALTDELGLPD